MAAPASSRFSPGEVVAILRSARGGSPDHRLDDVLGTFQRQWRVARKRYPGLDADIDDAIQDAMTKLTDPRRLDSLRDPTRVEAWARSLFVHTVLDLLRAEQTHTAGHVSREPSDDGDGESIVELLAIGAPGPEEIAAHEERLRLVRACIEGLEVARLKFIDDLPDLEIAARCNLTRDAVAGQLKRLRKQVRAALRASRGARGRLLGLLGDARRLARPGEGDATARRGSGP
jgi:RNA polymerase sigma factor (sigma-70 family)